MIKKQAMKFDAINEEFRVTLSFSEIMHCTSVAYEKNFDRARIEQKEEHYYYSCQFSIRVQRRHFLRSLQEERNYIIT